MDRVLDDAVIVDAGACVGEFAELFAHTRARIVAVECCPPHADVLRLSGRYEVVEAALVGEGEPAEAELLWNPGRPVRGNITGKWPDQLFNATTVPTTTLRALLDERGIERVDLLKLDIEGAEAGLLRTMTPDVAQRIRQIAAEIHTWTTSMDEADNLLSGLGFEVVRDDAKCELNAYRACGAEYSPQSYGCDNDVLRTERKTAHAVASILEPIGDLLERKKDGCVLDVGCGNGRMFPPLASRFAEVVGIDILRDADPIFLQPRVSFERADFRTYSPGRRFDVILFYGVFFVVCDAVSRLSKLLQPGGLVLICDDHQWEGRYYNLETVAAKNNLRILRNFVVPEMGMRATVMEYCAPAVQPE